MAGIFGLLMSGAGVIKDQYYNLTSLLLPGNGTNGAQNNTFLDSSGNTFTITRNGNTTQGTFSPFSQTGWGNYFSSTGLTIASNSAFSFGTGQFTFETWFYSTGSNSSDQLFYDLGAANTAGSFAVFTTTGVLYVRIGGLGNDVTYTLTSSWPNQWHHLAVVRDSSNLLTVYLDGQSIASGTRAQDVTQSSPYIAKGTGATSTFAFSGYLSNTRVVKGVAVYTGNFTPPMLPLRATQSAGTNISAITGTQTSLLTCQSNRFIDNSVANSGAGFTITPNGSPSVVAFSPFAPTQSYSAAAVGGSGYFDGTGDYLSVADNTSFTMGSGDFTVEAWVYCTAADFASSRYIVAQRNASADTSISFAMNFIGGGFRKVRLLCFDSGGSSYEAVCATDVLNLNAWTHIAGVRDGATLRIYVNGVQQGTANISTASLVDSDGSVAIGRLGDANALYWLGYISGLRITKGGCLYPSGTTFTPPTTPPTTTVSSGTVSLLTNFTNAGVVDATAKNVLETVGNAQISTSVSKFPGGSIAFDGTGDYLLAPVDANQNYNFGSGDFTVECWFYANSLSTTDYAALLGCNNGGVGNNEWAAYVRSNGIFFYGSSGTLTGVAGTINTGTWYHYAASRSGNTLRIFLSGTQTTSATVTGSYTNSAVGLRVGDDSVAGNPAFNGYLQDVRITKGYARYVEGTGGNAGKMVFNGTNTLALPTAPFPVQ